MSVIYDDQGEINDFSDDGDGVMKINDNLSIQIAINKLPTQQKRVAELILEGYKLEEIAKIMRLKVSTVYSYNKLIKEKLKKLSTLN